jgi:hypothetical protein
VTSVLFQALVQISAGEKLLLDRHFYRLAIIGYVVTGLRTVMILLQRGLGRLALVELFAVLPFVVEVVAS